MPESKPKKCALKMMDCKGAAEVLMSAGSIHRAPVCLSCGKSFQGKFSPSDLTIAEICDV